VAIKALNLISHHMKRNTSLSSAGSTLTDEALDKEEKLKELNEREPSFAE
jgi:hypothetical protein